MPDPTLAEQCQRVLDLSATMRRAIRHHTTMLAYEDAKREREAILASGWPEEVAREYLRLAPTGFTARGRSGEFKDSTVQVP